MTAKEKKICMELYRDLGRMARAVKAADEPKLLPLYYGGLKTMEELFKRLGFIKEEK